MSKTKKTLVSLALSLSLGGALITFSSSVGAVHIGSVINTATHQYWNIDGNSSIKQQWYTYRNLRVVNGYAFTGYTKLPTVYKGVVREESVYYNYRTW